MLLPTLRSLILSALVAPILALAPNSVFAQAFVSEIDGYLRDARHSPLSFSLRLESSDGEPRVEMGATPGELVIHASPADLRSKEKAFHFLVELAGVLEFPLERAFRYRPRMSSETLSALRTFRGDRGPDFFQMIELADDGPSNIVALRRELARLAGTRAVTEKSLPELQRAFRALVGLELTREDVEAYRRKAERGYARHMHNHWRLLERFYSSFSTPRLRTWVEAGDRKSVAAYLESILPASQLTRRELAFWRGQIEAIRNPLKENLVYVARGGPFNLAKGYLSRSASERFRGVSIEQPFHVDAVAFRTSILRTMYDHSVGTSSTFISTTPDLDFAAEFGEESGVVSVLAIDRRRVLKGFFAQWNEPEYLVPWIVFPDEVKGATKTGRVEGLVARFGDRLEADAKLLDQQRLEDFLSVDCETRIAD